MSSPDSVVHPGIDKAGERLCRSSCSGCYTKNICNLCPSIELYTYCTSLGSNYYKDYGELFRCDVLTAGCNICTKTLWKSCKGDYMYDRNDKDCYINRSLNPYYTKSDFVGYISCSSRHIMIESSNYCDIILMMVLDIFIVINQ